MLRRAPWDGYGTRSADEALFRRQDVRSRPLNAFAVPFVDRRSCESISRLQQQVQSRTFASASQHPRKDEVRVRTASKAEEVVIALGSNIGDRVRNFNTALKLMRDAGIHVTQYACLYETVPMHIVEQPLFLNTAVTATTTLDPLLLLRALKGIEAQMGRSSDGVKYGPRPIDLDIIFYGSSTFKSDELLIPHAMFKVRPFVLAPLIDLLSNSSNRSSWSQGDESIEQQWQSFGGESCLGREGMRRVLPVGDKLLDMSSRTYVMGVLNITPDSFSDGGRYGTVQAAVARFQQMVSEGADFVDIGAQSTRPNARRLSTDEELARLVPLLEAVASLPERQQVLVSVDTFDSEVAKQAVALGADMINDVSAGRLDDQMLRTIAELEVPCVLMHMRGDPTTMQRQENLEYRDLVREVASELAEKAREAEKVGVPAWRIVSDPGFGFSKSEEQNLQLLRELDAFREELGCSSNALKHGPMLAGLSRKRFLGRISGVVNAEERDYASAAAFAASVFKGANIVRAHNVRAARDAVRVADAVVSTAKRG